MVRIEVPELVPVEDAARSALIRRDPDLDNALANAKKNDIPSINVAPLQGQYLAIQCQLIGAKTVLEVGTLGGYSTIWFAKTGAKVTSIEINPKHRDVALENLHAAGLDAEVILGPALDVLPKLKGEQRQFDMVFIDADWGAQWDYFDWAVKMTRKGGCIYVDNVVGQLTKAKDEGVNIAENSLLAQVGKDERVKASMITTLSTQKGDMQQRTSMDGFLIAAVQ